MKTEVNPAAYQLSQRDIEFLDRILQDLFGVGLKLEYCLSVLEDSPSQARIGIEDAVGNLAEMMGPIRGQIHKLAESRNLA